MTPALPDKLRSAARALAGTPIAELFARDPARVGRLTLDAEGFRVDLSKERLTPEALAGLCEHARDAGLEAWIAALFAGEKVNVSEKRPALHPKLRDDADAESRTSRRRVADLADAIRRGERRSATGSPFRHVVHVGIGGSDLGPRLVVDALGPDADAGAPGVSFVANVDPAALDRALAPLDAASTLFVIASKSFTTQETLANANAARAWLDAALPRGASAGAHFVAATANPRAARAFGVPDASILPFPEGVGGRFSLWSTVGVTIALALGNETHAALLAGAHAMDRHFATTPFERNLPVVLALAGLWNASALGYRQRVVVPYAHALSLLPTYLQQLSLESNGKRVTRDGSPVEGRTAPALWGGVGTDGQHAFFQWLHQGTDVVPVEFIVPAAALRGDRERHRLLVANALAQAQALAFGRATPDIARASPGDRPSTTLVTPALDARALGALCALYEHRTFVEGILWGINPFDQFGVELGKILAGPIGEALDGRGGLDGADASTRALVDYIRTRS